MAETRPQTTDLQILSSTHPRASTKLGMNAQVRENFIGFKILHPIILVAYSHVNWTCSAGMMTKSLGSF